MDNILEVADMKAVKNIEAEKARLATLVFEGAPDEFRWAVMNHDGLWNWCAMHPDTDELLWWYAVRPFVKCKNQPETNLDWTETLLRRRDYEN